MDASKDDKSSGSIPSTRSSRISRNSYLNSLEREYVGGGRTKPPQDRRKPPHPYIRGTSFSITRHKPGEPFGYVYVADNRPRPKRAKGLSTMSQYEYCLANPSLGGTTDTEHCTIAITDEIRVGDGCGAQIVRVNDDMVAKFYDPVYYPTLDEYCWVIRDVVTDAEEDYRNEANTFEELQGKFDGTITPKYYGSWTLDLPVVDSKLCSKRSVRLVLMEYLNGRSMLDIDPTKLSEHERLNILFKAIEAEHTLWLHGITHCDFYPRNIMICGEPFGSPDIRICIIDFNQTRVARFESDYFYKGEI